MANALPPAPIGALFTDYAWEDWYTKVRTTINQASTIKWSQITDFTGSNINSIQTRPHNSLQSLQGGNGSTEYYHVTAARFASINSGITATITTAKLTTGGTNGSMTFTNGILTAQVQST